MSALEFLDTNILVYAYDRSEPRKQQIAQGLVRRAVAGEIAASSQVLGEFVATLLHKLTPPATPEDLMALLDALGPIKLVPIDGHVVLRAVQARAQYGVAASPLWSTMVKSFTPLASRMDFKRATVSSTE